MSERGRVRVYVACSFDGFIAGKGDDLTWLPGPGDSQPEAGSAEVGGSLALGFDDFMEDVGALLIGRRTYDVVAGFEGDWPYGERPVFVATHRALAPKVRTVLSLNGTIEAMIHTARSAAGGKDLYLDGGNLIRQALDAGLVDDLVVTMVPILLGEGLPLFAGVEGRHSLELVEHHDYGENLMQVHLRPVR